MLHLVSLCLRFQLPFYVSTEFNRNILSFIIKVFVHASLFPPPTPPILTINKKEKCVVVFDQC